MYYCFFQDMITVTQRHISYFTIIFLVCEMHFISSTALNERILNDELERMWKEAVFNILSHHLPVGCY